MRSVPPPSTRPASAVQAALVLQICAVTALTVFEQARGERLAQEIAALGGDPRAPGAQALVGPVTVFAVLVILVAVTTAAAGAAHLVWLARARRYAAETAGAPSRPSSGAPGSRPSPGAPSRPSAAPVLAAWFTPGLNLVAPPVLVDRLWRASRTPADHRASWLALLAAWWLSWLAALALLLRLFLSPAPGVADLTGIGPVELAVVTVSALLCGATVRRITRIQTESVLHRVRMAADPVGSEVQGLAYQGF
ncbi:hypothetical protein Ppa06_54600 [Planomonospora parontospora subsp. parontospora]|uniref:DUF4328 domain-containing protein n=2 Tax=Planomonospora parontospora TaxID=58119 RepID=A0AA37BLS2_9ACTN|nr:DUF4328 domain-containing protein [Planomonospora parontospora]GGK88857.1 hypothetical protein GCM10010126_55360 [Planomonospora parontospora]GII11662.1 hypothetical protein Ppa06_54600 [Planomonospora parontospora subsp. parontospora]